jgi:sulfoxide reductase heme-binding subunit YedZ
VVAATVGFISLAFLWLSVLSGTSAVVGWAVTWVRHQTIAGAHRTFTLVGLTLASVHALAQLAVPAGSVGMVAEFVPFSDADDRLGVGLGAIAWELMLAIAASALIARRLGHARWQALHRVAYVAYSLVCAHVVFAGSDRNALTTVAVGLGLLATVALRIASNWEDNPRARRAYEWATGRLRGREAVVDVDATKCVRFGFCEHEAPGIFRLRSDGRLAYAARVPIDQLEQAAQAARVCPARAIRVGQPATIGTRPKLTDIPLVETVRRAG